MRQFYKLPLLLIAVLLLNNCAGTYQPRPQLSPEENLARQIDLQIATTELEIALVGITVQAVETGEILYQHNANTLMMPASNEKIPTSAAALIRLGPDFRYKTEVYTTSKIEHGVLRGDLIIVGSGDPTLSYRFYQHPDTSLIFQAWADSLRSKGIHAIQGDIIGVDDVFNDEFIGFGWTVNNLSYAYAAQIGGLMYNENMARVIIKGDSSGQYMNIKVIPDLGYLQIEPGLQINPDETEILLDRVPETNRIRILGKIQPGERYIEDVSINDPTLYFLNGLKWELVLQGINIYGQPIDADFLRAEEKLTERKLLFTHTSPPFKEILTILMKESQNLYAESIV
ncbi:MAG: D-alanyl-D-alanine carboxypeptidase/D-alanyl-D-alanine-endopeptidase, partial [bacterium]